MIPRHPLGPLALVLAVIAAGCGGPTTPTAVSPSGSAPPAKVTSQSHPADPPTTAAPSKPAPASSHAAPASADPTSAPKDPPTPAAPPLHMKTPQSVRGLYITADTAATPKILAKEIAFAKAHHLNAVVVDVKDMSGQLSFALPGTEAQALGADSHKIADPKKLVALFHQNGLYVIGRVVCFADNFAPYKEPSWAITENGKLFKHLNIAWLSPWSHQAWNYNIQVGVAAAKLGFDEIQLDYIRLPAAILPGYNKGDNMTDRVAQVDGFLKDAEATIKKQAGVPVSGDIFGISSVTQGDSLIGQRYPNIARILDFVSPMDYPSLYAKDTFGLAVPAQHPYDTLFETVSRAQQRTPDLPPSKQRPWIQDFSIYGVPYGQKQVTEELSALAAAGIHSFLLWNVYNNFTPMDYSIIDKMSLVVPNQAWLFASDSLVQANLPVLLPKDVPTPASGNLTTQARSTADSYLAALWTTPQALPTSASAPKDGSLLLEVEGASSAAKLPALPFKAQASQSPQKSQPVSITGATSAGLAPVGGGVALTFTMGGQAYCIWAQDQTAALAAAKSLQKVTLLH